MIELTFDTNILRDYLDPSREHHQHAAALVRLDDEGISEIRVASRFTMDVPQGVRRRVPPQSGRPTDPGASPPVFLGRPPDQPLLRLCPGLLGRARAAMVKCRSQALTRA